MDAVWVEVDDLMQQSYVYLLTEPIGRNFDPRFRPELTPKQMLELTFPNLASWPKKWNR
jgi:hypothetical protein